MSNQFLVLDIKIRFYHVFSKLCSEHGPSIDSTDYEISKTENNKKSWGKNMERNLQISFYKAQRNRNIYVLVSITRSEENVDHISFLFAKTEQYPALKQTINNGAYS